MDCTTALMELPNGNLVRREAWRDGEYLYATFAIKVELKERSYAD